jgi:hypothetical protein
MRPRLVEAILEQDMDEVNMPLKVVNRFDI